MVGVIVLGVVMGEKLAERRAWIQFRYRIFRYQQRFNPRELYPKRTALVLIGDDEYWKGYLARRVPIKRDYLARLLRTVAVAEPAVIALDFDLRSPITDGSLRDHRDYRKETDDFLRAVRDVSQHTPIVLPRTIGPAAQRGYVAESAVYDGFNFGTGDVRTGYIELPYDLRQVPLPLSIRGRPPLDSLASAVVRAAGDDRAVKLATTGKDLLPYGIFIEKSQFRPLFAGEILRASPSFLRQRLRQKIVLIGASWSKFAYGRGGPVDETMTPIGNAGKVFLHANYIEALLDSRTFKPFPESLAIIAKVVFSLLIAYAFWTTRRRTKYLLLAFSLGVVSLSSYVLMQNFGLFFDFFIPLVLLSAHAAFDQVMDWRRTALSKVLSKATVSKGLPSQLAAGEDLTVPQTLAGAATLIPGETLARPQGPKGDLLARLAEVPLWVEGGDTTSDWQRVELIDMGAEVLINIYCGVKLLSGAVRLEIRDQESLSEFSGQDSCQGM